MSNVSAVAMTVAMIAALVLLAGGVKLTLSRQTRVRGILKERKANVVAVSEDEVTQAVRWAWVHHQLIVEPGGAAALAAVLCGKAEASDGLVIILSGGNVDPALHARIIANA